MYNAVHFRMCSEYFRDVALPIVGKDVFWACISAEYLLF
jgi:hypothetical protein